MERLEDVLKKIDVCLADTPDKEVRIGVGCGGFVVSVLLRGDVVFKTERVPDYQLEEALSTALDYIRLDP